MALSGHIAEQSANSIEKPPAGLIPGTTHLYIGPHEEARYDIGEERLAWYASFLRVCHAQKGVTLFCLPED